MVGRLSDHDYISIKSRESPTPRNIVINIENLGGRSTPNQYTIQKGTRSSLPSNLILQNGGSGTQQPINEANTLPLPIGNHTSIMAEIALNEVSDSDNEMDFNTPEPKIDLVWYIHVIEGFAKFIAAQDFENKSINFAYCIDYRAEQSLAFLYYFFHDQKTLYNNYLYKCIVHHQHQSRFFIIIMQCYLNLSL